MLDELKKLREITHTLTQNGYLIDQAKEWEYAFDAISDLVVIVNKDGFIKFANEAMSNKLKVSKNDLLNKMCFDVIGCPLSQSFCDNKYCDFNLKSDLELNEKAIFIPLLTGWYTISRSVVKSNTGKLLGHVCILRDISKQIEAEHKLKEAIERFELHKANTPLGMIEFDKNFNVISWNPAAEEIFGFKKEEIINKEPWNYIVKEENLEELKNVITYLFQDYQKYRKGCRYVNQNLTKDGRLITCEWFNTPLVDENDNIRGLASIVRDITEKILQDKKIADLAASCASMRKDKKILDSYKSERILIVDDESEIAKIIGNYVEAPNRIIDFGFSGNKGLQLFRSNYYTLVIVDLLLPDICGIDLIKEISSINKDTPIIAISGHGDSEKINAALRAGAWDFIRKPFEKVDIASCVDRLLEHGRLIKESRLLNSYM